MKRYGYHPDPVLRCPECEAQIPRYMASVLRARYECYECQTQLDVVLNSDPPTVTRVRKT